MDSFQQNSNNLDTSTIKQEIKIEAEDPSPLSFVSSSRTMKDPYALTQSTFHKVLLEFLTGRFPLPIKTMPQLTRFPVFIQDPFTLTAFAQVKTGFHDFLKDGLNNTPLYHNPPAPKKPEKPVTPTPPTPQKEQPIVKKEEVIEVPKSKESDDEKTVASSSKKVAPKKKAQNRIKNIPGLIMQRVRSSVKTYFTRNPRFEKQESRLNYVDKVFGSYTKQEKDKIMNFLEQYQKNWKTWNTIQKYLQTNPKCGAILLDVVLEFFGPDGLEDFNDWLTCGKMGEKSKVAVTEMKERICIKFSKILLNTEDDDDEPIEIKEKVIKNEDKVVKKEEEE